MSPAGSRWKGWSLIIIDLAQAIGKKRTIPIVALSLLLLGCQLGNSSGQAISKAEAEQQSHLDEFKGKSASDIPNLIKDLASANPQVRTHAAHYLSHLGESAKPAIPALLRQLDDKVPEAKAAAIQSLGLLQVKEALPKFRKLLENSGEAERWLLEQSIKRLE